MTDDQKPADIEQPLAQIIRMISPNKEASDLASIREIAGYLIRDQLGENDKVRLQQLLQLFLGEGLDLSQKPEVKKDEFKNTTRRQATVELIDLLLVARGGDLDAEQKFRGITLAQAIVNTRAFKYEDKFQYNPNHLYSGTDSESNRTLCLNQELQSLRNDIDGLPTGEKLVLESLLKGQKPSNSRVTGPGWGCNGR